MEDNTRVLKRVESFLNLIFRFLFGHTGGSLAATAMAFEPSFTTSLAQPAPMH